VVDLTDPGQNVIFNMSVEEARQRVASGDAAAVGAIDGHFALVGRNGTMVRLARSLSLPLRYFIAKRAAGPALVVADRIDAIQRWLSDEGLADQFHPSYTRMAPAHYVTDIALVGCPDPSPKYERFFTPVREVLPADLDTIGKVYVNTAFVEIRKWVARVPRKEPIRVMFSGGIDSGAVFLLTYHALLLSDGNPARLKAFTLSVDGNGADLDQARRFLKQLDLLLFHEPMDVALTDIDIEAAIRVVEDYKPLDVQAAAVGLALCKAIRTRYPRWQYLLDGDGGDENLKDYPIEENPELTIRSVLNNPLLYHEGWGVHAIKHSLTYSGGLSRGCTRRYAPAQSLGFRTFSPFMSPRVIAVSEGIPFIELTDWQHDRLYELKGDIVRRGVKAVTGLTMPVFEKRRFQRGVGAPSVFAERLDKSEVHCRRVLHAAYGL